MNCILPNPCCLDEAYSNKGFSHYILHTTSLYKPRGSGYCKRLRGTHALILPPIHWQVGEGQSLCFLKVEQSKYGGGMGFIVGCGDVMKVKYDVMRFEMYNILTLSEAMIMHKIYLISGR